MSEQAELAPERVVEKLPEQVESSAVLPVEATLETPARENEEEQQIGDVEEDAPEEEAGGAVEDNAAGEDAAPAEEENAEILTTKRKPKPKNPGAPTSYEKVLGTTVLPTSRVQKITKADKELTMLTKEAIFLISVATEHFVRRFMEEGYTKARLEKRKTVGLKDLAAVTARSQEFSFLEDIVPMPVPLASALAARKRHAQGEDEQPVDLPEVDIMPLNYLQQSTNPQFPGIAMRRPPNTHARHAQPKKKEAGALDPEEEEGQETPLPIAPLPSKKGKGTRGSRRSLAVDEPILEPIAVDAEPAQAAEVVEPETTSAAETAPAAVAEDDRMDED